jgi:hypothetical protein
MDLATKTPVMLVITTGAYGRLQNSNLSLLVTVIAAQLAKTKNVH